MTNLQKGIAFVIAGAVIGFVASAMMGGSVKFGEYKQVADYFYQGLYAGTSNQFSVDSSGKMTVGTSGTKIGTLIYGTCYLKADFSIAATSTAMVDCVSSSFASGDTVIIGGFATSSTALTRQFDIKGTGSASTTAGYAPVRVLNWTGAAVTPASLSGFGSSTPFVIIRP